MSEMPSAPAGQRNVKVISRESREEHIARLSTIIAAQDSEIARLRAVVDAVRKVIQTAEGNQRMEIHWLLEALAAYDDVEVAP